MIRHTIVSSTIALIMAIGPLAAFADTTNVNINVTKTNQITLPAEAVNKVIGVKINDLVNNFANLVPGLANLQANISKNPAAFFMNGQIQVVHTVFLNRIPEVVGDQVRLNLTAFVKYKDASRFEKIVVSYNINAKTLAELSIQSENSIDIKNTSFVLAVGLVDRKLIIQDAMNDIKLVFPIGVGAFDEGVMNEGKYSLLTPRFKNGYISQNNVISKREKPRYFDGKPFIRLSNGDAVGTEATAIGFHTEINDEFVRGFDSHGCMRLRVPDLMALHDLIMDGSVANTPITISYQTKDPSDHPAGKRNKIYKGIMNNGTKESPFFPQDKDNLVQLTYKEKLAPTEMLLDDPKDNYEDVFSYDTQLQMREQDARRKNECDAKLMAGKLGASQKDMDKCLDEGKRKDSFKDRLYRKYMGIDSADDESLI